MLRELVHVLGRALRVVRARPSPALVAMMVGTLCGVLLAAAVTGTSQTPVQERSSAVVALDDGKRPTAGNRTKPRRPKREREPVQRGPSGAAAAIDDYENSAGPAHVGAAIIPIDGSEPATGGSVSAVQAWSAMKVPAAAAYLQYLQRESGEASGEQALSAERTENLRSALVESTNESIREPLKEMIKDLGASEAAGRINAMLADGGVGGAPVAGTPDPSVGGSLPIGEAQWDLLGAGEFYRRLQQGCLQLADADRAFLMRQIHAAPTALPWGAGEVFSPGTVAYKPGWGGGAGGFTAQQIVVAGVDASGAASGDSYVAAIAVSLPGGDIEAAKPHLREISERVAAAMGTPSGGSGATGAC